MDVTLKVKFVLTSNDKNQRKEILSWFKWEINYSYLILIVKRNTIVNTIILRKFYLTEQKFHLSGLSSSAVIRSLFKGYTPPFTLEVKG